MRVEIFQDVDRQWHWCIRQAAGQLVLRSGTGYSSPENAAAAARNTLDQLASLKDQEPLLVAA